MNKGAALPRGDAMLVRCATQAFHPESHYILTNFGVCFLIRQSSSPSILRYILLSSCCGATVILSSTPQDRKHGLQTLNCVNCGETMEQLAGSAQINSAQDLLPHLRQALTRARSGIDPLAVELIIQELLALAEAYVEGGKHGDVTRKLGSWVS